MLIKNKEEIISNALNEKDAKNRKIIIDLLEFGLEYVNPKNLLYNKLKVNNGNITVDKIKIRIKNYENVYVIGMGKGSGFLAEALEELLGNFLTEGIVAVQSGTSSFYQTSKIRIVEGDHPIPGYNSVKAANSILEIIDKIGEKDLAIFLITGGGSAITTLPVDQVSLDDIKVVNQKLLESGADITEINAIRKHLTQLSGGRLAERIYPATGLSLIISDVVGDYINVISSGPTAPDNSTFKDALNIIKKYNLEKKIPKAVIEYLVKGSKGFFKETPKEDSKVFRNISNVIIGSNFDVLRAIKSKAQKMRFNSLILTSQIKGDAINLGLLLSSIIREILKTGNPSYKPTLILCGGETTVNLTRRGIGGRNQTVA
ncbi:MAG: glycerate kinase type-2 family protein [Candidatus Odinarchaeia archaeon]